ncbi:hypothetical protein BLNAU_18962 [Blattamonas nauphoetae]|uniref:Uncharacterized protein n=1 Tax=Blattamonas nauphoetae TaxID=2049346 RepID=A0ABQ9X714_9EUKA|nr:hypothetical protein BLNAU_18962 [Blattamonas nauphoetae]
MNTLQEPFLNFDVNSSLSFEDQSTIFCSLVALVKAEYSFDYALQEKTVTFLKSLKPEWNKQVASKLVTDLVPSSAGSPSGFIDSVLTLLLTPHSILRAATLSLLRKTINFSSTEIRCRLVESDLVSNVLATIQPHTLSISGNEEMLDNLVNIIAYSVDLAFHVGMLGITTAIGQYNHREIIFQKVVLPSSTLVRFLISNRYILKGELFDSLVFLLRIFIRICPFHHPTLEFVLASPIAMAFSSCLSFTEDCQLLNNTLIRINYLMPEWKKEGAEVVQSGKRMMQALFSEGFEDALEQMLLHIKNGYHGLSLVLYCRFFSQRLGSNVYDTED